MARVFPERLAQLDQVIGGVFWVLGAQIALVQRSSKLPQAIASVIQGLQANFGYEGLDVFGLEWQFFTAVNDGVYVFCAAFQLGGEDTSAPFFVHAVAKCGHELGMRLFYMLRYSLISPFWFMGFNKAFKMDV